MPVCIELPAHLEETLRRDIADLDHLAKESLLVDLYRQERITKHQLAGALGLDRFTVNDVLNRHNVTEDLPTAEEIIHEAAAIEALLERDK
jgi:hypothetical protein